MQLRCWHVKTLERVWKTRSSGGNNTSSIKRADIEVFPGFRPAMEGCLLDWSDYPIPGVTYAEGGGRRWYCPYVHVRTTEPSTSTAAGTDSDNSSLACFSARRGRSVDVGQLTSWCPCDKLASDKKTICVLSFHHEHHTDSSEHKLNSNRSSLSSEGFCENEQEALAEALAESCSVQNPTCNEHAHGQELSTKVVITTDTWNSQESLQDDSDGMKCSLDVCKVNVQPSTSKIVSKTDESERSKNSDSKLCESHLFSSPQHSLPKTSSNR